MQEEGAQDALDKGYLRKLNLSFALGGYDPISEANVFESYTLTFIYESGKGISQIASETRGMEQTSSKSMVLFDAKQTARHLVDGITGLWQGPGGRKLQNYSLPRESTPHFVVFPLCQITD